MPVVFGDYIDILRAVEDGATVHIYRRDDVNTAMEYQHPVLENVRTALNSRHVLRHTGETPNA